MFKIDVEIRFPSMPNYLGFTAIGRDATIDVAELDDDAVDAFVAEWGVRFRAHVAKRRA